jgi:RHS repeat-associated protein
MVNGTVVSGWLYQDQLRPVAQLDGTGTNVVAQFVYGSKPNVPDYMVTSGGTYRILSDHLGSPRAVVDVSSGNLIETINFDEFGNETDALAGTLPTGYVRIPFGFAGGLYDPDTGLVRFGARDYDASLGRWTTKDPIGFGGGRENFYVYVANDPVNFVDPAGLLDDPSGGYLSQLAAAAAAAEAAAEGAAAAAAGGAAVVTAGAALAAGGAVAAAGYQAYHLWKELNPPVVGPDPSPAAPDPEPEPNVCAKPQGSCSCSNRDDFSSGGVSCQVLRETGACPNRYKGSGDDTASCQNNARENAPAACKGCLGHCLFRQN